MTQLYKLTEQHRELQEMVSSGEMSLDDLKDTFEGLDGQFNEKAVSLVHVVNNMESDSTEISAEIERLQARKKTIKNKQDSMREYLRTNMEAANITKIECAIFSITLTKGRDVLVINNIEDIPDEFVDVKVVYTPDKKALLVALKAGKDVPGARIEKAKSGLRIK